MKNGKHFQDTLRQLFPNWISIKRNEEVVAFACGMMADPTPLVGYVYEVYTKRYQDWMRTGKWDRDQDGLMLPYKRDINDVELFTSIYKESTVMLPGSPYHNPYVNIYSNPKDIAPVYVPGRLHVFQEMGNDVPIDFKHSEQCAKDECTVVIDSPKSTVINSLLSICNRISQSQPLSSLCLMGIDSQELTGADVPIFGTHIQSLWLLQNKLPVRFLSNMLYQLSSKCSSLETLVVKDMQLHHLEDELDTLFESLAQNHHTNSYLKIWMANNTLSEVFKQRWTIQLAHVLTFGHYRGIDGNNEADDWLTLEESNWLIRETLDKEKADKKSVDWKEEDLLEEFYDDVEDEDEAYSEDGEDAQ